MTSVLLNGRVEEPDYWYRESREIGTKDYGPRYLWHNVFNLGYHYKKCSTFCIFLTPYL